MNALTIASKEQFFQQLDEAFAEKIAKTEAKKISEFAKQHYAHIPLEELISRRFSDTYGAILAAWQFLQKRSAEETPVSVFNPDLESDGWQSTHTVIFILHPNMPFLIDSLRIAINQREIGTHSALHTSGGEGHSGQTEKTASSEEEVRQCQLRGVHCAGD